MKQEHNIKFITKILSSHGFKTKTLKNCTQVSLDEQGIKDSLIDIFLIDNKLETKEVRDNLNLDDQESKDSFYFGCRGKKNFYFTKIRAPIKQIENLQNNKTIDKTIDSLKCVDSKMFRKSLDDLGLSRSGPARLSLTRIYRAGTDLLELTVTVAEEAERLSKTDEVETINILRNTTHTPFITVMAQLLWEAITLNRLKSQ